MRSKYKITSEQLIDKLSIAIEQCLSIIEQDITGDITEDKMHNVLKGKRMAAEDAIYYAKEIDRLEGELKGENVDYSNAKKPKGIEAFARE